MDEGQSQRQRKRAEEGSTKGASTSSFISPEATVGGSGQYDVFLSFSGVDTRKAFTDHLYHSLINRGIRVFRDDDSIRIGEDIGSKILDAITESKISIPVISKNYPSSKWCLLELIHIMDRKKSTSHIVLPIFYEVAPDVRNFRNALCLSQAHLVEKDIQKGQQALDEVCHLKGWESKKVADGYERELIARVVETVISELWGDFQLDVPKQLVGLDGHLKEIMNLIDNPSINARMIGIYGMGGIGKTTLAKRLYNELSNKFVHASFLPDVRETARCRGITYLQNQLISDIQPSKKVSRIDDGINIIKFGLRGKKVLIVLDDVDDQNQLDALAREHNWFTAGSMIIVTTRNKDVLVQSKFKVDKYELNGLDEVHALLLFNRHAFREDHSQGDFEGISRDIISTMGGLPLALKVVGSYLYGKTNQKVWEEVREGVQQQHLKTKPHIDVLNILRISYDALENGYKQIFLDIACFFIGKSSHYAKYMWEGSGLQPNQGIEELQSRCLIKIGDFHQFEMHDQLRDLGRSIFCEGQQLEKRSGPWDNDYEGVTKVLRQVESPWFDNWMWAALSGGSSNELLYEVRWLQWEVGGSDLSFSTTCLHLPNLSVLDLSWSGIKRRLQRVCICRISQCCVLGDDLPLPTTGLHLPNLSVLDLSGSSFTEDWEGWRSSFMTAKRLRVLNLTWCDGLRCTPDLSAFMQLKVLTLRYCSSLEHLHPSIGKLKSLVSLDLSYCESLKELPEEVGELKDLEELKLSFTGITEIPTSIGSLTKLKKLIAIDCYLLREIPSSIGDLQNLQHLDLNRSGIEKISSAIGRLKNLRTLRLNSCCSLKGAIPSEIGDLSSLEILDIAWPDIAWPWAPISDLPESIRNLSSLQRLYLGLQSLPEQLPTGLTYLQVTCQSPRLPHLSSLIHLEELHLWACYQLEYIPELPSRLLKLRIEKCGKLILLKLDGCEYLEDLSMKECSSIERLDLSQSIRLKRLYAKDCNKLVEIQGLNNLEFLEDISIHHCNSIERLLCPESTCLKKLVAQLQQSSRNSRS